MAIKSGTLYIDLKGLDIQTDDTDYEIGDETIFDDIARCKKHIVLQNFVFQMEQINECQSLSARISIQNSLCVLSMALLLDDDSVSNFTFYIKKRDGKTYIKYMSL